MNDTMTSQLGNSTTPIEMSPQKPDDASSYKGDETSSNDANSISFLETTTNFGSSVANSPQLSTSTGPQQKPLTPSNYLDAETMQDLEKTLNAVETTLTETPGMVKMEPDEQFMQQEKPYSISMVSGNCNPGSPFPAIEGKTKIIFIYLCTFMHIIVYSIYLNSQVFFSKEKYFQRFLRLKIGFKY